MSALSFLWNDEINIPILNKWNLIEQYAKELFERSNWTQLPDSGLSISKRLEWQAYRDTLRSIQDDFPTPDDVILPTEPARNNAKTYQRRTRRKESGTPAEQAGDNKHTYQPKGEKYKVYDGQ